MKLKINKEYGITKVPKGYRVIDLLEAFTEKETNEELKEVMKKDWIIVNTPLGLRGADLDFNGDGFLVDGNYNLGYLCRSRGVFVRDKVYQGFNSILYLDIKKLLKTGAENKQQTKVK